MTTLFCLKVLFLYISLILGIPLFTKIIWKQDISSFHTILFCSFLASFFAAMIY